MVGGSLDREAAMNNVLGPEERQLFQEIFQRDAAEEAAAANKKVINTPQYKLRLKLAKLLLRASQCISSLY